MDQNCKELRKSTSDAFQIMSALPQTGLVSPGSRRLCANPGLLSSSPTRVAVFTVGILRPIPHSDSPPDIPTLPRVFEPSASSPAGSR
jgi:hypothetical protein